MRVSIAIPAYQHNLPRPRASVNSEAMPLLKNYQGGQDLVQRTLKVAARNMEPFEDLMSCLGPPELLAVTVRHLRHCVTCKMMKETACG
jgi:hypothetical protein